MYADLTPEAMNTLVLKTLERLTEEKNKAFRSCTKCNQLAFENPKTLKKGRRVVQQNHVEA